MIVTVTINTTTDLVVFVPSFGMNRTIRATRTLNSMGGKPADASYVLGEIGIPSLALGCIAGPPGERLKTMLHSHGVTTDFITVNGETRVNVVIVAEDGSGQATITTDTLGITTEHIELLHQRYVAALNNGASCVVIGGTLPSSVDPTVYARFIRTARERQIPVIFDADEPNLSAGLKSSPTFVKPNKDELGHHLGTTVESLEQAYQAGRELYARYGSSPIITLGGEGALAVLPDRAYFIPPLKVEVVSANGAGDAVLAGLAASLERQQPVEEGLRLGVAAATAVVLMPGTAECHRGDVERFLPQVQLVPYPFS